MIFCHLAGADSLREITGGPHRCLGKIRHPGVFASITRSTLAYANQHRTAHLFQDFFFAAFKHLLAKGGFGHCKAKFRFKNPLLFLDATTISLCLSLIPLGQVPKGQRSQGPRPPRPQPLHAFIRPHHPCPRA